MGVSERWVLKRVERWVLKRVLDVGSNKIKTRVTTLSHEPQTS